MARTKQDILFEIEDKQFWLNNAITVANNISQAYASSGLGGWGSNNNDEIMKYEREIAALRDELKRLEK